ncbi:MAG: TPM domain-containing protein [Candidatus Cloacimonetes bacterium]|nr:TPM domain-containing protein [Candidatus Cloacimonadota bacterium]
MKKVFLTKNDLEKIKNVVQETEKKTSGEIVTAFIKESYDYAIYELIFAVSIGMLYFFIMTFFYQNIHSFINTLFWTKIDAGYFAVIFYGASTFLIIIIFYLIANSTFIDCLIIPSKVKKTKVHERAIRHFFESGTQKTRDRTGILIFISFLEKRVELLADQGIAEKIDQNEWNNIIDNIVSGIKKNEMTDSLIQSIKKCGNLLETHFPIKANDENELSDEIRILDK